MVKMVASRRAAAEKKRKSGMDETVDPFRSAKSTPQQRRRYMGVRQSSSGRWVAEIKGTAQKLRLWLGTFDTAETAARAYDEAACLLRGPNTRTNFWPRSPADRHTAFSVLPAKVHRQIHQHLQRTAKGPAPPPPLAPPLQLHAQLALEPIRRMAYGNDGSISSGSTCSGSDENDQSITGYCNSGSDQEVERGNALNFLEMDPIRWDEDFFSCINAPLEMANDYRSMICSASNR